MPVTPFVILVDSQEKIPYGFQGMETTVRGKRRQIHVETREIRLPVDMGDYMIEGIDDVTIERKSLEDLYGTLADRDAFRKQCETMNFFCSAAFVVIEATLDEIKDPWCVPIQIDWSASRGMVEAEYPENVFWKIVKKPSGEWQVIEPSRHFSIGSLSHCINECEKRYMPVERKFWRSQLHPHSVFATIASWSLRFPRVHWMFAGSRRGGELLTFEILEKAWRQRNENETV